MRRLLNISVSSGSPSPLPWLSYQVPLLYEDIPLVELKTSKNISMYQSVKRNASNAQARDLTKIDQEAQVETEDPTPFHCRSYHMNLAFHFHLHVFSPKYHSKLQNHNLSLPGDLRKHLLFMVQVELVKSTPSNLKNSMASWWILVNPPLLGCIVNSKAKIYSYWQALS